LQMQRIGSKVITQTLDQWRDMRDSAYERTFEWMYDSPWMRILAGQAGSDEPSRTGPCTSLDHDTLVQQKVAELRAEVAEGGAVEAGIRALIYIHRFCSSIDERRANLMLELH